MKPSPTILVTGCAGFIGSNFVRLFRQQFPQSIIVGIDDFSSGMRSNVTSDIVFYEGSICDRDLVEKIFKKHKPDYVFHFAAIPRVLYSIDQPAHSTYVNIYGTVLLLEKSKDHGVKRFIFSSSSSVYGRTDQLPMRESQTDLHPVSPYAYQKYSGEYFCKLATDLYGLDTVSLRYFNVYGPGDYGRSAYSTAISAWLAGHFFPKEKGLPDKGLFLHGSGRQSRDFCYVDNVVAANICAMKSKKNFKGEAFNVAHGETTSLIEVRKLIERHIGARLALKKMPPRKGDVRKTHADISKAEKRLGYRAQVDFREGLKRTIEWFEDRLVREGSAQRHAGKK